MVGVFLPQPSGKVLRWLAVISAVLFIFLTVSATGASPLPALSAAEVIEVIDGSTIRVRAGDREEVVRLIGVGGTEAQPQGQQPEPRESTSESFIRSQLEGRTATWKKTPRNGMRTAGFGSAYDSMSLTKLATRKSG